MISPGIGSDGSGFQTGERGKVLREALDSSTMLAAAAGPHFPACFPHSLALGVEAFLRKVTSHSISPHLVRNHVAGGGPVFFLATKGGGRDSRKF